MCQFFQKQENFIYYRNNCINCYYINFSYCDSKKKEAAEQERYNNLPVKVDISMTSYFGEIYYILYELGLDFDLVTMGANCFTGTQKGEFKTEKYGILHTEYRYCKSNYTLVFKVYNDSKDQELRDPKPGELAQFDKYGKKVKSNKENNF